MIGTFFSLIIALFFYFNPFSQEITPQGQGSPLLGIFLLVIAILFVLIQTGITLFAWSPLCRAEQKLTPRIIERFKNDWHLKLSHLFLLLFLLFTFVVSVDVTFLNIFNRTYLLMGWTLFFGLSIDVLHYVLKRVMDYLDPFHVVNYFGQSMMQGAIVSDEEKIHEWIDALAATAIKSTEKNNLSLAFAALEQLRLITETYLQTAKGITYHEEDDEGTANHVGFTLFYLLERLEVVYKIGVNHKQNLICNEIITVLGKIVYYSSVYDLSIANHPLHYLEKFAKQAHDADMNDVTNRASVTLIEVSRVIINEVDLQYIEIKEFFLSVIDFLHETTRENFRADRSINISVLTQPFDQLKQLFKNPKIVNHRDTKIIIQAIDHILEEFATLQSVLQTMPLMGETTAESVNTGESLDSEKS